MEKRIFISTDESDNIQVLYGRYCSYVNILGYLAKYGSLETDLFDKKWEEAVMLDRQLTKAKEELDRKYHPNDGINYKEFSFDFNNHTIIYTT